MKGTSSALLAAALVLVSALAAYPVAAGTEAAPEVTDAVGDQEITGQAVDTLVLAAAGMFGPADLLKGWIAAENGTAFNIHILLTGDAQKGINDAEQLGFTAGYVYTVSFNYSAAAFTATATFAAPEPPVLLAGAPVAGGAASAASYDAVSKTLNLTISKIALSSAVPVGSVLSSLFITAQGDFIVSDTASASDRAPDGTAFGGNYTFVVAPGAGGPDADGDGLSDAWEMQYFNNTTTAAGVGDNDSDGLNNTQEQALGTDPTKADTDGDGFNDGAEVAANTDPKDANSKPVGTPPPPTPTPTPTSTPTPTPSPTATPTNGGGGDDDDTTMDKLTADPQYLGIAGGGALVIIILAMIGRFGRWGL